MAMVMVPERGGNERRVALVYSRLSYGRGELVQCIILKTAVAGVKMAHLPKIALAFDNLHHFNHPYLPFLG
jgi:hypothetical protein